MGNTVSEEVIAPPANLMNAGATQDDSSIIDKNQEPNAIIVFVCLSPYCSVSRSLNAELPKIASEFPTANFYKVNTESNTLIPNKFNVQIVPHTAIIARKNGEITEYAHIVGNKPDEIIKNLKDLTTPPEEPKKSPLDSLKNLGKGLEKGKEKSKEKEAEKEKEKEKEKDKEKDKGKNKK